MSNHTKIEKYKEIAIEFRIKITTISNFLPLETSYTWNNVRQLYLISSWKMLTSKERVL